MQRLGKVGFWMVTWLLVSAIWLNHVPTMTQAALGTSLQLSNPTNHFQANPTNNQLPNMAVNPLITGTWQSGFNDLSFSNGAITSAITDAAGNWYFGGYFNQIDGVAVHNIARWNGTTWSALPTSPPDWSNSNYRVSTMAFWGDDLYVGGANMRIGGLPSVDLAYWDGSSWHQAGSGFDQNGTVSHIAVYNSQLFFYGNFEEFNGVAVSWFARWDGTNTRQVYANMSEMQFMQASATKLYIGGKRWVNESLVDTVAVWDGAAFQTISSGEINPLSLKIINDQLYGVKKLSATSSALMRWDGSAWVVVIDAIPFVLHNFAFDADQFYAEAKNGTNFALYSYVNQEWQPITTCNCNAEHTLYLAADQLFITSTRHKPLIAYANNQWQEVVVKSTDPYVAHVTTYQDDVYIASIQTRVINNTYKEVHSVRSWENNAWKTIYQVPNTSVLIDIQAVDDGVYFTLLNQWSGFYDTYYYKRGQNGVTTLPRIGLSEIYKLFVPNDNTLYAIVPGSIYKWDGTQWISNSGLPNPNAQGYWLDPFIYNQQLHLLTEAGISLDNRPLLRIFRRDGTQWIDQNVVLEGYLSDSSANANGLYIAGQFYHDNQLYRLVQWDGSQLQFIDTPGSAIEAVAAEGTNLYVGGMFDQLPGCVCYNIGYWNGFEWRSVGGGTNGRIRSLSLSGDRLYLTGWFSQTGNVAAVGLGLWIRNYIHENRSYLPLVSR